MTGAVRYSQVVMRASLARRAADTLGRVSDEHPAFSRTARPIDRTVRLGPQECELYDVWVPPAPIGTTVVLVHGGFWRARYDRHHLEPLASALALDGFHVANIEFPRVGMPSGGWPGMGQAVAARVDAVRDDQGLPDRLAVVGHSAGGHLALWLASSGRAPEVSQVVALAPAVPLAEVHARGLSRGAAQELMGCLPEQDPDFWAEADPDTQRLTTPTTVIFGPADADVPPAMTAAYAANRRFDEPCTMVEVPGADHFDLIDPGHAAYEVLRRHLPQ